MSAVSVHRVSPSTSGKRVSAFLLKLTDTSLRSFQSAKKGGNQIKVRLEAGGGLLQLSENEHFRFSLGDMGQGGLELLQQDKANDRFYSCATIAQRVQVQATEQSYQDTRQRAMQMAEDASQHTAKTTKFPGTKQNKKLASLSRPMQKPSSAPAKPAPPDIPKNPELMRKPLRERLIHLLALKVLERNHLIERLTREGLTDTDRRCLDTVLAEVSVKSDPLGQKLMLKPSLLKSVDVQWIGYDGLQRQLIKKKLTQKPQTQSGATVTPPGKTSIVDDLIPLPEIRRQQPPRAPLKRSIEDRADAKENKRHKASSQSPPEDPAGSPQIPNEIQSEPSTDSSFHLPTITNEQDYEKYANIFQNEYPKYMEVYNSLKRVAKEFSDLGKRLEETATGTMEHRKLEQEIRTKFAFYKSSESFQAQQQTHNSLRSKLSLIKSRVTEFEKSQSSPRNNNMAPPTDDLTVM